jgi:hypothetical protein
MEREWFCLALFVAIANAATNDQKPCPTFYMYPDSIVPIRHSVEIYENGKNEGGFYLFGDMYATAKVLIESFLALPARCRTENPSKADYFVVPFAPLRQGGQGWDKGNVYIDVAGIREAFDRIALKIRYEYPLQWKEKKARHIWFLSHDYGSCLASPELIQTGGIFLTPNGDEMVTPILDHGVARVYCDTMIEVLQNSSKKRNKAGHKMLGGSVGPLYVPPCRSCFDATKDIVVPPWIGSMTEILRARRFFQIEEKLSMLQTNQVLLKKLRPTLLHFRGTVKPVYDSGTYHSHTGYSLCNIRQKAKTILSGHGASGVLFEETPLDLSLYLEELQQSIFCLSPPGWAGWSPRFIQSLLLGCIPVFVLCDPDRLLSGIQTKMPFQNELNYSQFSITISVDELGQLPSTLKHLVLHNSENIVQKMIAGNKVWRQFIIGDEGGAFDMILRELANRVDWP